jgi:SAM-dependent methyltransferase
VDDAIVDFKAIGELSLLLLKSKYIHPPNTCKWVAYSTSDPFLATEIQIIHFGYLTRRNLIMGSCRMCGHGDLLPLLDFGRHPIAHRLLSNPSDEEYVHGVALVFCESCALVQIADPLPKEALYTHYNWLSSWKWNPHIDSILDLIEHKAGVGKDARVLEVASNDGTFLQSLIERGYTNVSGIEPAQDAVESAHSKGIETIGAFFNQETAQQIVGTKGQCDLFVARQVLEHISDLPEFCKSMGVVMKPGAYVYMEVPNTDFILSRTDYSLIWEEHVNYFNLGSLKYFLAGAGVEVLHSETASFSGEALMILGKYTGKTSTDELGNHVSETRGKSLKYAERWPGFRVAIIDSLENHRKNGGQVAIYGAGCRACSLINLAGLGPLIDFVADDQPEKQGKYMPGSRIPIIPGSELEKSSVDLCLLAVNAESEDTVVSNHSAYLSRGGRFASVLPPSDRLLPVWDTV